MLNTYLIVFQLKHHPRFAWSAMTLFNKLCFNLIREMRPASEDSNAFLRAWRWTCRSSLAVTISWGTKKKIEVWAHQHSWWQTWRKFWTFFRITWAQFCLWTIKDNCEVCSASNPCGRWGRWEGNLYVSGKVYKFKSDLDLHNFGRLIRGPL